jgi:hypothetical protein
MASQAETKRIAEFIGRVREAGDGNVRMIALAELSWIHNRKKANGEKYSELVNRKLITAYRAAIKAEFGEDSPLLKKVIETEDGPEERPGWFHYSDTRTKEYKAHQTAGREEKHRNQRPLDPEDFIESALLSLGHAVRMRWSTPIAIAALCALTGRRPYEVAVTGHFAPDPDDHRRILFSGQAKTRDVERAAEEFSIPVLADRELVLEAIAILRTKIEPMDNTTFSQRFAKEIGIASKRAFKDLNGEPIKPRDLREAYAAVAYYEFAPRRVTEIQFLNDILGHKTEYLDTTLYYLGFYIDVD